jgi:ADP-ribose pyrophosphatase YjhB (NUDIX family)
MKKAALQIAFRLRRWLYPRLGVRTRGVKVMVFNPAGELLLVRHSYGNSSEFLIPGGGLRPFEAPEKGAAREIREEVGMTLSDLKLAGRFHSKAEGWGDTVHLFTALGLGPPKPDNLEIEEARFFPLDALPDTISPSTRRRIEEYREGRLAGGRW